MYVQLTYQFGIGGGKLAGFVLSEHYPEHKQRSKLIVSPEERYEQVKGTSHF